MQELKLGKNLEAGANVESGEDAISSWFASLLFHRTQDHQLRDDITHNVMGS